MDSAAKLYDIKELRIAQERLTAEKRGLCQLCARLALSSAV